MALPRVMILGTADSAAKTAQYKTADLTVNDLMEAVPELKDIASLKVEKVCQVGSPDITGKQLVEMAGRIDKLLASAGVDGVVITHGTDTLEETAYFLDLTIQSPKPIVVVGAMRPATAMSEDGPRNLYGAVKLASCKEAHNRGVLVFHDDKIIAVNFVTKVHANSVDAFTGGDAGCLGSFDDDEINFYSGTTRPSEWTFPIGRVVSKIRSKRLPRYRFCTDTLSQTSNCSTQLLIRARRALS